MIVVSNTSPIINLAQINQLDLLRQLYEAIAIPQAVYDEIVIAGAGQAGAIEVKQADWIKPYQVSNRTLVLALQLELDLGEAEAIALALELTAELVLIDEQIGRAVAQRLGLKFVGLLGALLEAKRKQLIPALKPLIDELKHKAGFWINEALYADILQVAGE